MPSILATAVLAVALTGAPTLVAADPANAAPTAAGYRMVDLGTLGGDSSYAIAMSDGGDVVGRAQDSHGVYRGFLWRGGRMIDLGAFEPTGVNDRGEVVGISDDGSGGQVWRRGVLRPLGGIPVAINDRGQVVGSTEEGSVLWSHGRVRPLPLTVVSDVNERGQVSGGVEVPGGFHAAVWHRSRVGDLGAGPFDRSNTYGINDLGWVIGWQFSAEQFERGILWRHGGALDVGTLGGSFTQLRAINNRGEILASSQATDRSARPALWRRGVLYDLSLAGVSTEGEVVDLDDLGRVAASIRPVWGISRAVVYYPR